MNLWVQNLRNEKNRKTSLKVIRRIFRIALVGGVVGVGSYFFRADRLKTVHVVVNYEDRRTEISEGWYAQDGHLWAPVREAAELFSTTITFNETLEGMMGDKPLDKEALKILNPLKKDIYVDIRSCEEILGCDCRWESQRKRFWIYEEETEVLPEAYDVRDIRVLNPVENQGNEGVCWAYATIASLEINSGETVDFSETALIENHGFNIQESMGGDYPMSLAYLSAWKGPVADGNVYSHLQEAHFISSKNIRDIKRMVFEYGSVESSMYISMTHATDVTQEYDPEHCSYYYNGDAQANHDVVIVGWDDHFSRYNFKNTPQKDGAFICRNSWGESFGENGYFYVSYEDQVLGTRGVVYSGIENVANYDHIYQSDLLGWVGTLGYGTDTAWFANVYESKAEECLKAISFYTVSEETSFDVYIVSDYEGPESLKDPVYAGSGFFEKSGYYTVELPKGYHLTKDEKFAVVLCVKSPKSETPIAVEYEATELTNTVDLTDGEGFISFDGLQWTSTEMEHQCNLCLKAFTDVEE